MDPKFLDYYNRELQYMREMGGEFAKEFPKIAGRLGLDQFECSDPYVERLLEGFSFLAARIQLKLDADFPKFTQYLLDKIYPHYLSPTPSMVIAQFTPNKGIGALADGFKIPRDSVLHSNIGQGDRTPCEYRTAHDVALWPIEVAEVEYFSNMGSVSSLRFPGAEKAKAGLRMSLRSIGGLKLNELALDRLPVFLHSNNQMAMLVYEQIFANAIGFALRPTTRSAGWYEGYDTSHIHRLGFDPTQGMLPYTARSFDGYRLLQEYFAFSSRYMFVEFAGLNRAFSRCDGQEIDLIVLFNKSDVQLEDAVESSFFLLFCTPAINLFPKRTDRIHLNTLDEEYHIVPDRTRPTDFEVYQVTGVRGYGTGNEEQTFLPFYAANGFGDQENTYYNTFREARVLSSKRRHHGSRSSYTGSEVFLSIVDGSAAPFKQGLNQLSIGTLCTNRDLPLHMTVGQGQADFTLDIGAPTEAIRCIVGPTKPVISHAQGDMAWRLVNHLALNYYGFSIDNADKAAASLRELLMLYAHLGESGVSRQIDGIRSLTTKTVTRRLPISGPVVYGRGVQITLTCDETAYEGTGVFLLGAVLELFFAKYVTINSFTETVMCSVQRGEIMRWPARIGLHQTL